MNFTPFETPRLRLRPQEARDAGFALCIWGDPITGKYLSDTPLDAIDDLNEYMELLRHLSDAPDCYYMIAEDKVTGQPIGTCCAVIKNGGTCWDIGYCIHPTRWRQGYANLADVAAENLGSCAVMRVLGFTPTENGTFHRGSTTLEYRNLTFRKEL